MPTGRVAVFTTSGVPFDIVELPTPEVEPGGLLVKNTDARAVAPPTAWHSRFRERGQRCQ